MKTSENSNQTIWARKKTALKLFEIGYRKLDRWSRNGFIRTIKLDEGKRGTKLYYAPDIEDLLLKLSAGHKLLPKLGKISR